MGSLSVICLEDERTKNVKEKEFVVAFGYCARSMECDKRCPYCTQDSDACRMGGFLNVMKIAADILEKYISEKEKHSNDNT